MTLLIGRLVRGSSRVVSRLYLKANHDFALEDNTTRVSGELPVTLLEKVRQNFTFRIDHVSPSRRKHLHNPNKYLIFL